LNQQCSRCGKVFGGAQAVQQHVNAKHGGNGHGIPCEAPDDDDSLASRAIQAELYIAMGLHTDDGWLLP
jgi:hypothetical protein